MSDYQPLDISHWCNSGLSVLGDHDASVGLQSLRGLPFFIGSDARTESGNCLIALGGEDESLTIPVNEPAYQVVFAHRLLETDLGAEGRLGVQVAEYVFQIDGDREERVPIRERFEIATVGRTGTAAVVPGLPFRAVTDQKPFNMPRWEGPWGQAGFRLIEARPATVRNYYLWTWKNPSPDHRIEAIEIVPAGPRFVIAAITLGHMDEHPFPRQGRRAVQVILTDPEDAIKPFDLNVTLDRGDSTYVYPLPGQPAEGFLRSRFKGWGEEPNLKSSPAYVEISAVPSATVTVKHGDREIGSVRWGDIEEKKSLQTPKMRVDLIDRGRNWVHVAVVDDDTGRPVPCRVHFRSPEGVPYQPHGHNLITPEINSTNVDVGGDIGLGQTTYAYIDGSCQGWLPRGEVIVDVARGFEYEPLRAKVTIGPGQQELTLRIKRWIDMNNRGWYSGDSHAHFLSTRGGHLESLGEDLNVVNLLQSQWGSHFSNIEDFTGEPSISKKGNSIVYVGQENRQHFMGHMNLWGLKKHVMPWCSDGAKEAEMGGTLEITMSDWADQTHAQGGYVIGSHFPSPNATGESAALIATGRLDAVEMIAQSEFTHREYYRYLNCGYRLPLVGGTDKMSNQVPVGIQRTYVNLRDEEEFNYENWAKNVAHGRTFFSSGPMIHFSVDGCEIGDAVHLSGPGTVEVETWAESIFPLHTLQIVQTGRVVASTESRDGARQLKLKDKLRVDGHTWLAARCGGPDYYGTRHIYGWPRGIFAHTSPVYVACGGNWWMFDQKTAQYMLTIFEGNLAYVRETSTQYQQGHATHHHGEDEHIAYLERPFLEASAAVHERMRKL